jgi:hypothetical protein
MGILEGSSLGYSIGYKVLDWRFQIILELPMKFIKESTFFTKLN